MHKNTTNEILAATFSGALASVGIGPLIFQALGTLILGAVGALGGYLLVTCVKPRLDKLFAKKKEKKA